MSNITYDTYIKTQNNFEAKHFQYVNKDTLIEMFGHELNYNQLNKYITLEPVDLKVAIKTYDHLNNLTMVTVWINNDFVGDIKIKEHDNPPMFHYFDQLE